MAVEDKKEESNKRDGFYSGEPGKNPKPKFNTYWIYGIVALAIIGIQIFQMNQGPQEIFMKEDLAPMLTSGDVVKII